MSTSKEFEQHAGAFARISLIRADIHRGLVSGHLYPDPDTIIALMMNRHLFPLPKEDHVIAASMQAVRQEDGSWRVYDYEGEHRERPTGESEFVIPAGKISYEVQTELAGVWACLREAFANGGRLPRREIAPDLSGGPN